MRRMAIGWAGACAAILAMLGGCHQGPTGANPASNDAGAVSEASDMLPPGAPAEFAVCTGCHSIVAGQLGVGPSLRGVVGRHAGSLPGFGYSAALRHSGIVWTPERLDVWLAGPMSLVPGTRMSFGGYADPVQRRKVIDYLQTLK